MEYINQKMKIDTLRADGWVYFTEDYLEFRARDARLASYNFQIRYDDITGIETYGGIKKTVVLITKDGGRHFFYMYKMNTFVAIVESGRKHEGTSTSTSSSSSTTERPISSEDLAKLSQLNDLHKDGVLSDEEFERQKTLILNKYR